METRLYYLLGGDGRPYGPAGAETVRQWLHAGRVNGQSQANLVGTPDWQPLARFTEFADVIAPPSLPAPPFAFVTAPPRRTHPLATAGFICGLLSLTCCACCAGEVLAVLAVVLSTVALVETGRYPERYEGRGLAIAGIVLGGLGLVLGLIGIGAGIAGSLAEGDGVRSFHWP